MSISDFRSDTVTKPTQAMRRAMAEAEVGDDVFEDDPTVRKLEERVAELFGRGASLYCPSGTQANQIALGLWGRPGDEVLMEERSHSYHFEAGGTSRLWGLQANLYRTQRGIPDPGLLASMVRPDDVHMARTTLCVVENTHNFHGGRVVPVGVIRAVRDALPQSVRMHIDGARLWNAHVASGTPLCDYAAIPDSVMVALSKGMGCPVGSMVIADKDAIREARRLRKLLGGGMRQVGVLAAPALVALDEGFDHIAEDHRRAKVLAEAFGVDPATVDSNIVIIDVGDGPAAAAALRERDVWCVDINPTQIRLVTHKDVGDDDVERACKAAAAVTT
jgi:threonine aldolase